MNLGRRGLLKLMGVAPAAAGSMAAAAATQAAGYAVLGLGGAGQMTSLEGPTQSGNGPKIFTSFLSYLKDNEAEWRRSSKNVSTIDPDIAMMRLPLPTKVRMQSERNFERIKESSRSWFEKRLLRDGEVREW